MTDIILSDNQVEQVRNAVIAGLDVASGARSKATYYHSGDEQRAATRDQIGKIYNVSKELPLILGSIKGATGFFIQEAMLNEFEQTTMRGHNRVVDPRIWNDERLCNRALLVCLDNLDKNAGLPYILRMFASFKERKINNRRSRDFALSFIWGHRNLEFISVKYREKLRVILTHLWGERMTHAMLTISKNALNGTTDEKSMEIAQDLLYKYSEYDVEYLDKILLYIFGKGVKSRYLKRDFPVIFQVFKAKTDFRACNLVPEEVITGLLADPNHPQHAEFWGDKERQTSTIELIRNASKVETANQAVRKTKQEKTKGIKRAKDRTNEVTDPIALLKTIYETSDAETHNAMLDRLHKLAIEKKYENFPYNNIGVVFDGSRSMRGHRLESKNTPLAISEFTKMVLQKTTGCSVINRYVDEDTNLAEAFLNVITNDMDAVFILSDGYENAYDGLLSSVVKRWKALTGRVMPIFHVSPLGFAEANAKARPLGDGIVSMVADHKTLNVQIQSHMLEADTRLWLSAQISRLEAVGQPQLSNRYGDTL
jgi:hypothetical protein